MANTDSLHNITFELLEAETYYQRLSELLPRAKKQIVLVAMCVLWDEKTGPLFTKIEQALERGVQVHIVADVYTRLGMGYKGGKKEYQQLFRKTINVFESLQKKGARVELVGKIGLNPFKGRCHAKITVIDDHCFTFGGVNFIDQAFANHDIMLYARHTDLADCLQQLVNRIGQAKGPLPDGEVPLDDKATILFDGGEPKHSIIFDRAVRLAAQSKHVWFVSQYVPNGRLGRALQDTNTTYYFNRPEQIVEWIAQWAQAFDQQYYQTPNNYHGADYIHAKFMLFELQDGSKALISGSNNFSYRGVAFGTKEIALYSTDSNLWDQLFTFTNQHINRA